MVKCLLQYRKLIKDYGAVAVSTANQSQAQVVLPNYGDLKFLDIEETVAITVGTGTARTISALYALHNIVLRDKNQQPVINAPEGYDIPFMAFMLSSRIGKPATSGKFPTISAMGATGGTAMVCIPTRLIMADQPAVLDLTIGTISDLCSTVGTATATIAVKVYGIWEDAAVTADGLPVLPSLRIEAIPKIAVTSAGDNVIDMSSQLGRLIDDTGILSNGTYAVGADADITAVTLAPSGGAGLDAISTQNIIDEENLNAESGHQTGFYKLGHSPYTVTTLTKFIATCLVTKVLRLYLMRESV